MMNSAARGLLLVVLLGIAACERERTPERAAGERAPERAAEVPVPPNKTGAGLEGIPLGDRVREALRSDMQVATAPIEVSVTADGVVLTGSVPTPEQREWAGRVAQKAAGAAAVKNDLVVAAPR